jgi:hypothetical protein
MKSIMVKPLATCFWTAFLRSWSSLKSAVQLIKDYALIDLATRCQCFSKVKDLFQELDLAYKSVLTLVALLYLVGLIAL